MKRPWWQQEVTIAWTLILFAPVGLFLMWRYAPWRLRFKWGWSVFFALVWLFAIAIAETPNNDNKTAVSAESPKAPKTAKPVATQLLTRTVNGPNYIKGPIRVLPPDPFKLDSNQDGVAC